MNMINSLIKKIKEKAEMEHKCQSHLTSNRVTKHSCSLTSQDKGKIHE